MTGSNDSLETRSELTDDQKKAKSDKVASKLKLICLADVQVRKERRGDLLSWIAANGGSATVRDVTRNCSWLKGPGSAEAEMEALVLEGAGVWRQRDPLKGRGRPTRVFVPGRKVDGSNEKVITEKSQLEQRFHRLWADFAAPLGLPLPFSEHQFAPDRLWRLDFAWVDHLVAVELEGGIMQAKASGHRSRTGVLRDIEKTNRATLMGWRVLRYWSGDLDDRPGDVLAEISALLTAARPSLRPAPGQSR